LRPQWTQPANPDLARRNWECPHAKFAMERSGQNFPRRSRATQFRGCKLTARVIRWRQRSFEEAQQLLESAAHLLRKRKDGTTTWRVSPRTRVTTTARYEVAVRDKDRQILARSHKARLVLQRPRRRVAAVADFVTWSKRSLIVPIIQITLGWR